MICPNCGENNSVNFRFCGMCGTALEARRPAGAPRTVSPSDAARSFQNESAEGRTPANVTVGGVHDLQSEGGSSAGPPFRGLNQSFKEGGGSSSTSVPSNASSPEESFSGLDSFFEPDEPGVSGRGIAVLLVLLAALGVGGWWAYTEYRGAASAPGADSAAGQSAPSQPGTESAGEKPTSSSKSSEAASSPIANSSSSPSLKAGASQPAGVSPAEPANSAPSAAVKPAASPPKIDRSPHAPAKPAAGVRSSEANRASQEQKRARAEVKPAPHPAAVVVAASDKGDAEFKRGEAYLYGRGMPENCNEAVKSLKEASAKQNAKARSAFGTMYATGHCVPRDLPTSYSWFAQALRVDPNNQILEKDLTAVWNQMTPPERQLAVKSRQ